jgi:galactokinase
VGRLDVVEEAHDRESTVARLRQDVGVRTVTASAPGRVNLIGEHLDYNGGLCLPIAIDRRTTVTVGHAATNDLRSDRAEHGWERYVLGVLAALGVDEPLRIDVTSTVPVGAGLSSSAALTCSVALAVDRLLDLGRSRDEVLAAAVAAENAHVGVPTGGMDQAAALFGEPGHAVLLDFDSGTRELTRWSPEEAGLRLLVVDTGVRHRLADSTYADRRAVCEATAAELGLTHLARATTPDLGRLSGDSLRRARHVVTEQQRVRDLVAAAEQGAWEDVGRLMTASHVSLRDDFEVSCTELDEVVDDALAAGALGARMTGGGFGGSAIVLVAEGTKAPTGGVPVEASRGASVDQVT